jgi:predicted dehydrogenase
MSGELFFATFHGLRCVIGSPMSPAPELNRRNFLRLASAGALSLCLPRSLSGAPVGRGRSPGDKITIGVIGCGWRGVQLLTNALGSDDARVIATCDVNGEAVRAAAALVDGFYGASKSSGISRGCRAYRDFRELLACPDLDAVIVATPDHWHALITVAAVDQGKDVYLEKPASLTIREGQAMVDAALRTGAVIQVGSQQRSTLTFQRLVELTRNGFLGEIRRVIVRLPQEMRIKGGDPVPPLAHEDPPAGFDYDLWLGPAPKVPYFAARCDYNWRWSFDYSGGQVANWIGHHYDIAAWAMGLNARLPEEIFDARATFPKESPLFNTATSYSFSARYADGRVIEVQPGTLENSGLAVRIEGAEGWAECSRAYFRASSDRLERVRIPSDGFRCTSVNHLENFLECVRSRREPVCPIADGHCVAAVAHLANAAFRSGRSSVRFDAQTLRITGAPDADALLQPVFRAPWILPV